MKKAEIIRKNTKIIRKNQTESETIRENSKNPEIRDIPIKFRENRRESGMMLRICEAYKRNRKNLKESG